MLPCKGVQSESESQENISYCIILYAMQTWNSETWDLRIKFASIVPYRIVQVLFHLSHSFLHYIFATPLGEQGHVRLILPVFRIGTRLQTG